MCIDLATERSEYGGAIAEKDIMQTEKNANGNTTPTTDVDDDDDDDAALDDVEEEEAEEVASRLEEISSDSDDDFEDEMDCDEGESRASAPQRRARVASNDLLLFDWDDTLLPSTYLQQQGLRLTEESRPTEEQWAQLKELSLAALRTLSTAKRQGHVVLITNAERGWVELSCRKFSPWLLPALEGVKVLSARSEYEHQGIASPFEWKYLAFENEIASWNTYISSSPTIASIISIGDAGHERLALLRAAKYAPNCRAKSVKLVERPGPPQLMKQHELLGDCLRHIVRHEGNLDLCFKFL